MNNTFIIALNFTLVLSILIILGAIFGIALYKDISEGKKTLEDYY